MKRPANHKEARSDTANMQTDFFKPAASAETSDSKIGIDEAVVCKEWLGGWNDVNTTPPPIRDWVSGRGWSDKPYVLAVDAKGRMSIGFATKHSSVPFIWTFAKPIGEVTHWMPLPRSPHEMEECSDQGDGYWDCGKLHKCVSPQCADCPRISHPKDKPE